MEKTLVVPPHSDQPITTQDIIHTWTEQETEA